MTWLGNICRAASGRPAGSGGFAHVRTGIYLRDTYDIFSRNVSHARDALFPPLARRPAAKACNHLLGTRIVHNSYVDIILHAIFVSASMSVVASAVGTTLGLSALVVENLSLAGMVLYQSVTDDGLLRPYFN